MDETVPPSLEGLAGLADDVRLTVRGGVATVTLERPAKRNALTFPMRARLAAAFAALDAEPDIRVVILTGSGPAFCAGVDLEASAEDQVGADEQAPVTDPLDAFRKPVVAAINGPAMGGGLELALAADLRIASDTARFALTEVRIGSLAGSGGITRLSHAITAAVAARMVLTGDPIDAAQALQVGLVSEVLAGDDLLPRTKALAERIAANAPLSILAAKASLRAARELALTDGVAQDRTSWARLKDTADRAEGRAAFRAGRPPRFTGR